MNWCCWTISGSEDDHKTGVSHQESTGPVSPSLIHSWSNSDSVPAGRTMEDWSQEKCSQRTTGCKFSLYDVCLDTGQTPHCAVTGGGGGWKVLSSHPLTTIYHQHWESLLLLPGPEVTSSLSAITWRGGVGGEESHLKVADLQQSAGLTLVLIPSQDYSLQPSHLRTTLSVESHNYFNIGGGLMEIEVEV